MDLSPIVLEATMTCMGWALREDYLKWEQEKAAQADNKKRPRHKGRKPND